ncbi:MAG: O-antigen ligase family protein [Candidatus Bipolaricaulota bacterium]
MAMIGHERALATTPRENRWAVGSFLALVAASFFGVALLPFRVGSITLFPFRILLVPQALLACITIARYRVELRVLKPLRWYVAFLAVWLVYAALSLLWTPAGSAALADLGQLAVGVVFVLLVPFFVRTSRHLRWLAWLWLGALVVLSGIGLCENALGAHLPVSGYYQTTRPLLIYRPTSVYRNPNDFAMFLALGLPFALAKLAFTRRRLLLVPSWVLVGLVFYLIILTGSRAALLAAVAEVATLVLVLVLPAARRAHGIFRVAAVVGAFLCANIVPGLIDSASTQGFTNSWHQMDVMAEQIELETESIGVRWVLVLNGVQAVRGTQGLGTGVGGTDWWMENRAAQSTQGILSLHNWWLELLVVYGVPIALLFCLFYGSILMRTAGLLRRATVGEEALPTAVLLSLVGLFLAVLGPSSVLALKPFWLVWGTALAVLSTRSGRSGG